MVSIDEIVNKEGYIYIMYDEMFNYYGDDVYKIGKAKDIGKRMNGYITSYIKPVEVKYASITCSDCGLVEFFTFKKLIQYRTTRNR